MKVAGYQGGVWPYASGPHGGFKIEVLNYSGTRGTMTLCDIYGPLDCELDFEKDELPSCMLNSISNLFTFKGAEKLWK